VGALGLGDRFKLSVTDQDRPASKSQQPALGPRYCEIRRNVRNLGQRFVREQSGAIHQP
jgi:hypothetical protein